MKLYIYSKDTKELIGETEAHLDPLESLKLKKDVYVIPPYCTPFPPLKTEGNTVNVFNTEKRTWELVEDNRGITVYNKKGDSILIEELGGIPVGYSKIKPVSLQEEKIKKVSQVNIEYSIEQAKRVSVGSIVDNIDARVGLSKLREFMGENEFGTFTTSEGIPVILNVTEVEYLLKYFYVRSILLPVRRNEILKEIKQARNLTQLNKIEINFDINKETEQLANKTDEEISDFIREKLK